MLILSLAIVALVLTIAAATPGTKVPLWWAVLVLVLVHLLAFTAVR